MGFTTMGGSNKGKIPLQRLFRAALLCFLVWLQTPPSPAQSPQPFPQPQQTIRVRVDRVNVGVIVTDAGGRFVEGLHREDFQVFDNGVEQPITDFLSIEEPAQLVLLVECGPAVYFLKKSQLQAADTLITSLSPADRVAIVSYSKSPELLLDFTPDKTQARFALRGADFTAGFAQLNLSSSVATILDWLAPLPTKKTILVLSTGVDTSPPENWNAIEQKLKTSDVRLFAVSVSGDFRKPAKRKKLSSDDRANGAFVKQVFAQADQSLRELSEATGGRVYFPQGVEEFDRAYVEIAQLVRHEYSLAFAPSSRDGGFHSIEVKVKQSSYRVDHRRAYVAPSPGQQ